jgi:hypothetical protein
MAFLAPSTKQQAYDHPAYEVPITFSLGDSNALGSGGQARFVAWTNMIVKAATLSVGVAGTNTSTVAFVKVAAAGTTTTTIASLFIGTGVVAGTSIGTAAGQFAYVGLGTTALAQGDTLALLNGIDATAQLAVSIEAYLTPGASLTA